jgi:hypothetical protein
MPSAPDGVSLTWSMEANGWNATTSMLGEMLNAKGTPQQHSHDHGNLASAQSSPTLTWTEHSVLADWAFYIAIQESSLSLRLANWKHGGQWGVV